jgi:hypothetical protein
MKTLKHSLALAASIILFTAFTVFAAPLSYNEPATISYTTNGADPTYSIYVRPQGQIANSYPSTYQSKAWQPPCFYINSPLAECRSELWKDPLGTATFNEMILGFPALKPSMITQVEQIRATALARSTTTNTGVMAVWEQNYQAAVARLNGLQDATLMKNGMTAEEYLTGLGAQIGMNSLQFAQYVINESINLAPKAYEIEQEYLRLKYQVIPNTQSVFQLMTIPIDYQTFCAP